MHVSYTLYHTSSAKRAYLRTTKLNIGSIHLLAQHLVDGRRTRQDNRLTLDLDNTLTKTNEVGTDTDRTSSDHRDREYIVVRPRRLAGNQTRAAQTLDTETLLETNDRGDLVAALAVDLDLVRNDATGTESIELVEVLGRKVEVVKALLRPALLSPRDIKQAHDFLCETDTRARVGR